MPVSHTLMHMGVSGGHLGVGMAELFLNQADVFCFAIEVGAAAMAEDMAGVAGVFEVAAAENAVHDVADAVAADAAVVVAMVGNNGGGEGTVLGGTRTGCQIAFQNGKGGIARVNHSPMAFTADVDGAVFPVDIFIAKAVDLHVAEAFHAHEVNDQRIPVTNEFIVLINVFDIVTHFLNLLGGVKTELFIPADFFLRFDVIAGIGLDEVHFAGRMEKGPDSSQFDGNGVFGIVLAKEVFHIDAHLVVLDVQGMPLVGKAPFDKGIDMDAVIPHGILGRSAAGNITRQELPVVSHEKIRRDGGHVQIIFYGKICFIKILGDGQFIISHKCSSPVIHIQLCVISINHSWKDFRKGRGIYPYLFLCFDRSDFDWSNFYLTAKLCG